MPKVQFVADGSFPIVNVGICADVFTSYFNTWSLNDLLENFTFRFSGSMRVFFNIFIGKNE